MKRDEFELFEALLYAYGRECSKGNEYDNRGSVEEARQRVLTAFRKVCTRGNPPAKIYVVAEYNDDGFSEAEYASFDKTRAKLYATGREKYTAITELEIAK